MPLSTSHYRTLIRCGLAVAMVATPLIAYAKIDREPIAAQVAPQPTNVSSTTADPAVAKTSCDTENWPFISNNCLTGGHKTAMSRQIALVTTDAPLTSLPRVITAPITGQHVVAKDARMASVDTGVASGDTRRVSSRRIERRRAAVAPAMTTYDTAASQAPTSRITFDTDRAGW